MKECKSEEKDLGSVLDRGDQVRGGPGDVRDAGGPVGDQVRSGPSGNRDAGRPGGNQVRGAPAGGPGGLESNTT